jgi:hypothetical protein
VFAGLVTKVLASISSYEQHGAEGMGGLDGGGECSLSPVRRIARAVAMMATKEVKARHSMPVQDERDDQGQQDGQQRVEHAKGWAVQKDAIHTQTSKSG